MRIVVVGAGALGGLVAAQLSEIGEDLAVIEINESRARLINESGLLISEGTKVERCVPLRVVTSVTDLETPDLVFVAVKSYQTRGAVESVLPLLGPNSLVLSMQNGLGNTEVMTEMIGSHRVLCGITYHSMQHVGPNRLRFRAGIKPIQIAPHDGNVTPQIKQIGEVFRRAGLDTNVVENIDNVIWQKLLHNAVVNPVSALTDLTCQEMLDDEDLQAFMRALCMEIIAVMRARGIPIVDEEDPYRPVVGSQNALGKNRPSMWQDLAKGTRTEVDAINGAVLKEAERRGISAPLNFSLVRFIHSRERQNLKRRQEISLTLEAAARPESPLAPKVFLQPTPKAPEGGMPRGPMPLQAIPRLKELLLTYYQDVQAASDDPERRIAYASSTGPVEIVRAMGITPYFPEHHAALIGSSRQTGKYIPHALAGGFSHLASSAMNSDIGAMLAGDSPLVSMYGIAGPPRPDLVVFSTNGGNWLVPWFEFYGRHFQVPLHGLHPPSMLAEVGSIEVRAAAQQLHKLISRLQGTCGTRLDMDRLAEVVEYSAKATRLWREILALAEKVPSPLTFFDTLIHVGPLVVMRGTPEAVEYYTILKAELEDRLANNIAAVPGEGFRFYWEGPPIWCALRPLAELFHSHHAAIVGSSYAETYALRGLDPENPIESMARAYTSILTNRSDGYKEGYLVSAFQKHGVDGVIYHESRTCPEHCNVRFGLEVDLRRATALQAIVLEADTHDLRLFSMDRVKRKLENFIEMQEIAVATVLEGMVNV